MATSVKYANIISVALLIVGGATLLFSCSGDGNADHGDRDEGIVTQQSDSLTILQTKNGLKSYRFETPLMEQYDFAYEPYREFRRGIYIETYNDSTGVIESTLIADYAINFLDQKLWEAKGNVKATNAQGHILETQQLFWNETTGKIYSNIDSKVTQGDDVLIGVGFESDERFEVWEFRRPRGKLRVNVEPNRDTTSNRAGGNSAAASGESGTINSNNNSTVNSESARTSEPASARPSGRGSGLTGPTPGYGSGTSARTQGGSLSDISGRTDSPSPRERQPERAVPLEQVMREEIMIEPMPEPTN